jgi:hypothetical protein
MKKNVIFFAFVLFLSACTSSKSEDNPTQNQKKSAVVKDSSDLVENKAKDELKDEEQILTFKELYPKLKKSLLEFVCEAYTIKEEKNTLLAYSKESEGFLSSWEWDLNNKPLMVKDIDDDGLVDYTIELFNSGGGCGGQIGEEERWTLFGSKPNQFKCTHIIPYRSETGKWERVK